MIFSYEACVINKMLHFSKDFLRFLFSGFINTIIGYSLSISLLIYFDSFVVALAIASAIGACSNYIIYSKFGFRETMTLVKFFRFIILYIFMYLISLLSMRLIMIYIPSKYVAYTIFFPLYVLTNYHLLKRYIFNKL